MNTTMTKDEALSVSTTKLIVPPNVDAQAMKNAYDKMRRLRKGEILNTLNQLNTELQELDKVLVPEQGDAVGVRGVYVDITLLEDSLNIIFRVVAEGRVSQ